MRSEQITLGNGEQSYKLLADEGKVIVRIIDGVRLGSSVSLGYEFFVNGAAVNPPVKMLPGDYTEEDMTEEEYAIATGEKLQAEIESQTAEEGSSYESWRSRMVELINEETDNRILCGHTYNGHLVWLTNENQFNYKAGYDIAIQTNGANLPFKIKLGDNTDVYYRIFETIEEFSEFYLGCVSYISRCLQDGWNKKDALTIEEYNRQMKKYGL